MNPCLRTALEQNDGNKRTKPATWCAASPAGTLTLEAATSWAVLAAISWEQTISSSYLPVCRTTLSADSLQAEEKAC